MEFALTFVEDIGGSHFVGGPLVDTGAFAHVVYILEGESCVANAGYDVTLGVGEVNLGETEQGEVGVNPCLLTGGHTVGILATVLGRPTGTP